MTDGTVAHAHIVVCPPERAPTVTGLLHDHDLTPHLPGGTAPAQLDAALGAVVLGYHYLGPDAPVGTAYQLGSTLQRDAPDTGFVVWDEPHLGCLGTVYAYLPDVGTFMGSCDYTGTPLWTTEEVLALLDPEKKLTADGEHRMGLALFARVEHLLARYRSEAGNGVARPDRPPDP
jgi:hypothetical protein